MSDRREPRWLRERRLARWCRNELSALGVSAPLDIEQLRAAIEQRRGKPLHIDPYPLDAGVFGLWLGFADEDRILYQSATVPSHQPHIILHELGHVLLDHPSDEVDTAAMSTLMPHLPTNLITAVLRRSCYDDEHEQDAELVATIIREWDQRVVQVTPRRSNDSAHELDAALIDRLKPR